MIRFALIAIVVGTAAPAAAERMCERGPMSPRVWNRSIAGSGGMVVASGQGMPDWRYRNVTRVERAHVEAVAPGLWIYHPPPLADRVAVLENTNHDPISQVPRELVAPDLAPAPALKALTSRTESGRTTIIADLSTAAPDNVIIAIVSRVVGDKVVPLTWVPFFGTQNQLVVYHTPYGCEPTIPDAVEPKIGERVVLTWIDNTGRVSEASKPVTIVKKAAAK